MSLQSTSAITLVPVHGQVDSPPPPPPPPADLTYQPTNQDLYMNSFGIVNRHATLHTLIDAVYPKNRCSSCDSTSGSETDQRYTKSKEKYLCLYPHCDQVFRSRGVLRFHIASCHIVVQEQVSKSDPLYLLYAPPSIAHISMDSPMAGRDPSFQVFVPKKRKYERKKCQTNEPKRRGRPPKPKVVETSTPPPPPPPVFRLVQQTIPSATHNTRASLSLLSKTLLAEKYNPLRCPSCHLGFKRKTNVVKHLASAHPGQECFQCVYPDCDHPKRFSTREGLVYHILRMHDHDHRPYDSSEDTVDEDSLKTP